MFFSFWINLFYPQKFIKIILHYSCFTAAGFHQKHDYYYLNTFYHLYNQAKFKCFHYCYFLLISGLGTTLSTGGESAKIKLDYITVPVLAKYSITGTGLGIYVGPQVGYTLSSKIKAEGVSVDVNDSFKKADFSGIGGVDYSLPFGLSVSARYQLGLINIAKEASGDESAKNNAVTLSVGFSF
ncbi:MAG: PorT family protein [Sphingobacteriaceae bacterium]|nr:MAG: PorT family protein [Sphingobacteriaceae bacterium]